jgi:hypothetical protein
VTYNAGNSPRRSAASVENRSTKPYDGNPNHTSLDEIFPLTAGTPPRISLLNNPDIHFPTARASLVFKGDVQTASEQAGFPYSAGAAAAVRKPTVAF